MSLFFSQGVPALGFQLQLSPIPGDKHATQALVGDMAHEAHPLHSFHLLIVADAHGEQQFVVFAAVECAGGDIHVEFLSHECRLVVNGYVFLKNAASASASFADVV